ncbi:Putative inorganic phosphate cotransporter [Araneus ventricosus]|uniref:Inorganic phosphate cotransporter n=1 Tax=Araneus ventricosus TaxID=182803 RepID=A0A4Y2NPT3_ARAVE|nr:Putative inorganic phosphate cotransporter [Araneus ventricosus]
MNMTKAVPEYGVDISRKCYDNPAYDDFKTLYDSSVSANPDKGNVTLSEAKEKTNSGRSILQYRYIVTLFGFFLYFQLDCYRIATSMSVVKMVNNTAVNFQKNLNGTINSCPLNYSVPEELPKPVSDGEFDWNPEMQSYIQSAGFFGYLVSQIPGGMLAEAHGAKNILVSGVLISSLAHMLCPFAAWCSCYLMIAMQFLRGVGQGFFIPSDSVMAAKWFTRQERGFHNSIIYAGSYLGSLITYATSGGLCSSTLFGGWPLVYFVYGGLGLVLGLCAHLFLHEIPKEHPRIGKEELVYILENQESDLSQKQPPTPWRKILTSVPVYAMTFAIFSHFILESQQMSEHPIFLGNILHFPIQTNGMLNSIPFAFQILLIFLGGWVCKWLNTHGYVGVDKVRKGCTMLYSLGSSISLLGVYFVGCDRVWSNVFSIIAFSFVGLAIPGCVVVPADMSPTFAGSLFAFSNTLASSAMFVYPLIVGAFLSIEESLEQWNKIFLLCIAVIMSSGILFCLFGSAEVQPWNFPSAEDDERIRAKDEDAKCGAKECTQSKETSNHL